MRSRHKRLPRPRVSATSQNPPDSQITVVLIQDAGRNGGQHPMGQAYSPEMRERVAVASVESCRAVDATFKVTVASVVKWSQRFHATGSAVARPVGGNPPLHAEFPERLVAQTACRIAGR